MNKFDALLLGADSLVFRHWHHGAELLDDAEIEMGVSYELYTCDLAKDGAIGRFRSLTPVRHAEAFFEYLAPRADQKLQDEMCLDEIPREDWILVFLRYHANLLRACGHQQSVATGAARQSLAYAMLCCPDQWRDPV